ncbi:hypothetical protein PpBr36_07257 [Pyricularia pennisetigena]|uniref:hypothetical protein n=1 Tax=Pyricularia pennisetigena TaxID=1578925 RepID=UPI001152E138|nr:hypothetical protein PpBr36_07257 [Pyricularia pennisetigena]TLS25854.1 hypothetical protein PpBr36_07257 [Pyricularia pennisetigena]
MATAAMPTVASSALTPPSSSHGVVHGSNKLSTNGYHDTWDDFSGGDDENPMALKKTPTTNSNHASINSQTRSPLISQNGNSNPYSSHAPISRKISREIGLGVDSTYGSDMPGSTAYRSYGGGTRAVSPSESIGEISGSHRNGKRANGDYGSSSDGSSGTDEASKWIHRDKLARIESEELQAAGIILPTSRNRSRSRSRPRVHANGSRTRSESTNGATRSRKNSTLVGGREAYGETKAQQIEVPSWDLRLPEEIADEMESNYWTSTPVSKNGSKIPVAKVSPAPIPVDYIERESPAARKRESSPADELESIKMPRTRARSSSASTKLEPGASSAVTPGQKQTKRAATDTSPKKPAGARKTSGPTKATGANGRPKTRGGTRKDSSSSSTATRPTTRSGDRELAPSSPMNKQPEGDPPWMVSAYKPDPRLPPDQQLLPTVAKRLQQEKWEREGKFGSVYDREFRPLSDDGLLSPPDRNSQLLQPPPNDEANEKPTDETQAPDWPLKTEALKSPSIRQNSLRQQRTGSYSTIPKVQEPPISPIPGSRGNPAPGLPSPLQQTPAAPTQEKEDKKKKKNGCMCCIVM